MAKPSPSERPDENAQAGAIIAELTELLRRGTPLLDVRAPGEYEKGSVPNSVNLPILNDEERAAVGTRYKQAGASAATELGHALVNGETRAGRIDAWRTWLAAHPDARLTCWRGGQRSAIAQQWLADAGVSVPRIPGGYKALRHACLHVLATAATEPMPWLVLGGRTGTGKTVVVQEEARAIDLEGLAHHRGSAFGGHGDAQPPPATFENALACSALAHEGGVLLLEDESRTIGRLAVPETWHARMQQSPLVLVEADLQTRAEHIAREYIDDARAGGQTDEVLHARYADALRRIARRLGGLRHDRIRDLLNQAFEARVPHTVWITALLAEYYDPMYDYQLKGKRDRVVFRGSRPEVTAYLAELDPARLEKSRIN